MPKRSHRDDDSDYIRRKIRKLEKKIKKRDKRSRIRVYSETSSSSASMSPPVLPDVEDVMEVQTEGEIVFDADSVQPSTSASTIHHVPTASPNDAVQTLQTELPADPVLNPPELDEDILNLLGETPSKDKKYGPDIRSELAVRWEHIATTGLTKDAKKELLEKHLVPNNCTKIDAPKLNPEIKAALSEMLIKKDKALENKQTQVAASVSCISEALNILFASNHKDQTVIKLLIEAGRLLCDSQHSESMTRRNFICSSIKKEIKDHLYNTEIDNFLFGEKLADTLKAAKAISKSGAEIKNNTPAQRATPGLPRQQPRQPPSIQALNQRPPPPPARQAGASRRTQPTPRSRQQQPQRRPARSQQRPAPRR